MNTTDIGNEFENKVFKYFSSLLNMDEVCTAPKRYSKIFQHKRYPIRTGRKIDFDITIETYNPYTICDVWSSLVVIECKCYNEKVNIADLDEFETKLHKVSDSGIKGIMVTTKGFSQKSIAQAKDAHIGLVVLSDIETTWLVSRDTNYKPENLMSILQGYNQAGIFPVAYTNGIFLNITDLLKDFGVIVSNLIDFSISYMSKEAIQNKAEELHKAYPICGDDIAGETLIKAYPEFKITFSDMPQGLLGSLSLKRNIITMSNEIINDIHRRNFTLAHEIGHLCLHQKTLRKCLELHNDFDEQIVANSLDEIIKRMEKQADLFASYLLLPKMRFHNEVNNLFERFRITKGYLFLDYQPCNRNDVNAILGLLSQSFNISKEAIKIRLLNDDLLKIDNDGPQRLSSIFRNLYRS